MLLVTVGKKNSSIPEWRFQYDWTDIGCELSLTFGAFAALDVNVYKFLP